MGFFSDVANYQFLQQALITSILVGIGSGVIGSFVILRGMSLMGDAISHAVLPGVAISFILGIDYFIGAAVCGVIAALCMGFIERKSPLKSDASIGIILSSFLALGMIMITIVQSSTNLYHILFGNILAVTQRDLILTAVVTLIVLLLVALFYKQLLVSSFDETIARTYGINTQMVHYFLMVLLTLMTVVSLQTVGVILVVAMLITPAATAYLLTDKMSRMIILAAVFGAASSVIGLYFSFEYNLASGAAIVVSATIIFAIVFLFSRKTQFILKKEQ